uniref:zinc-ribbon domain-containing protein n=1 Tax=Microterricola viridarii TaxID=412690 RepID=UPI0009F46AAD
MLGFNDLATLQPAVAASWHPTKNGDMCPSDLTQFSNSIRWWQCDEGTSGRRL